MKSWLNKGDDFIEKYESLKRMKEQRDKYVKILQELRSRDIKSIKLSIGFFSKDKEIDVPWTCRDQLKKPLAEFYQGKVEYYNQQMEEIESKICNEV